MSFSFYPNHEYGCKQVGHCPHLGGASLGTLVLLAVENQESRGALLRQLDAERQAVSKLVVEVELLKKQLAQAKLELKLERQAKFATNRQKQAGETSGTSVPRAIEDLFGFRFTPASLLRFERLLTDRAEPIVEDIRKKIASSDEAVHADETYWLLDGQRSYYWIHAFPKEAGRGDRLAAEQVEAADDLGTGSRQGADLAGADQTLPGLLAGVSRRSARAADQQSCRALPAATGDPAEDHVRTSHAVGRDGHGAGHDDQRDGQTSWAQGAGHPLSNVDQATGPSAAVHLRGPRHGGLLSFSVSPIGNLPEPLPLISSKPDYGSPCPAHVVRASEGSPLRA